MSSNCCYDKHSFWNYRESYNPVDSLRTQSQSAAVTTDTIKATVDSVVSGGKPVVESQPKGVEVHKGGYNEGHGMAAYYTPTLK